MTTSGPLDIDYRSHERVQEIIDIVRFCVEDISVSFDRWDEPQITGPGLYFAIVSGHTVQDYADPMGDNRWPVSACRDILADAENLCSTASDVARTRDGAVVISVDGVVQEQMVRFQDNSPNPTQSPDRPSRYANWMGARHMSAADTSARPSIVTTITLSAETGRVTVFEDGDYTTTSREELDQTY